MKTPSGSGLLVASIGAVALGAYLLRPRPVVAFTGPGDQGVTVAASGSTRPPSPTLPLQARYLQQNQLVVLANLDGAGTACWLDTGTSVGLAVPALMAQIARWPRRGSASVTNVSDSGQGWSFLAPMTLGADALQVNGIADPGWHNMPLIGLPLIQYLYPSGWTWDLQRLQMVPLTTPYAPPPSGPLLPLSRLDLATRRELIGTVRFGAFTTQIVMDTGNQYAAWIGPEDATAARVRILGPATGQNLPAGAKAFEVPITVSGRTVTVHGIVDPAWTYLPLLGVPFWRALYPVGWTVNLARMRVQPA